MSGDDRRWVTALLMLTIAMGMLDAVSLLHLGTFTGYMTGTVILMGMTLSRGAVLAAPPITALAMLLVGAVLGGRLVRRTRPRSRLIADILLAVAVLVGVAGLWWAAMPDGSSLGVVALLALAMGLQTSATRHAAVPDMTMPAATMVLHGLAHDSRLAGGKAPRVWRRAGILAGLLCGAALGTLLSGWRVWAGLEGAAALILVAAMALLGDRDTAEL